MQAFSWFRQRKCPWKLRMLKGFFGKKHLNSFIFWTKVPSEWLVYFCGYPFDMLISLTLAFSFSPTLPFFFKKRFYLFIFRERGREGEREGKKHQRVVASLMPPIGNLARNPVMCPDWESNQWPFGLQACDQSTEPHQPGLRCLFFLIFKKKFYCYSITVVCIFSLSLHLNPPPSPASTLPLDFVHVSFIVVPVKPSPHCPLCTPLWLLLDCS